MDEYTADAKETEREAQKALKKIEFNKARAEVTDIAAKANADKAAANEYKKYPASTRPAGGGGSAGGDKKFIKPAYKSGGKVSASSRADGCAIRGKTRA